MSNPSIDDRRIVRVLGRGFVAGAIAVGIAAVIAYALGSVAGILVLIVALGVFTAGIGLLTIAGPMRRPLRFVPTWTPTRLALTALVCAILVPVVYTAGMAYGASWLEWDPVLTTYFYTERPGGFAVIILSLAVCVAASAVAVASAIAAILGVARRASTGRATAGRPTRR